jgi:hypothetical protein
MNQGISNFCNIDVKNGGGKGSSGHDIGSGSFVVTMWAGQNDETKYSIDFPQSNDIKGAPDCVGNMGRIMDSKQPLLPMTISNMALLTYIQNAMMSQPPAIPT